MDLDPVGQQGLGVPRGPCEFRGPGGILQGMGGFGGPSGVWGPWGALKNLGVDFPWGTLGLWDV